MTVKWLTHDHQMKAVRQKGNQTHCPSLETKSSKPLMVTQTMDNRVQEGLASYPGSFPLMGVREERGDEPHKTAWGGGTSIPRTACYHFMYSKASNTHLETPSLGTLKTLKCSWS